MEAISPKPQNTRISPSGSGPTRVNRQTALFWGSNSKPQNNIIWVCYLNQNFSKKSHFSHFFKKNKSPFFFFLSTFPCLFTFGSAWVTDRRSSVPTTVAYGDRNLEKELFFYIFFKLISALKSTEIKSKYSKNFQKFEFFRFFSKNFKKKKSICPLLFVFFLKKNTSFFAFFEAPHTTIGRFRGAPRDGSGGKQVTNLNLFIFYVFWKYKRKKHKK